MTELKFAFFFPLSSTSYLFAIARAVRHREAVAAVTWSFLHLLRPVVRKDILQWVSRSFSSWPHTSTSDGKSLQSALSLRPSWSQKVAVSQIETKNEDEDWIHLTQRKKCQRQLPTPTVSTATAADGISSSSSSISRTNERRPAGRTDGRAEERWTDGGPSNPTEQDNTAQRNNTGRNGDDSDNDNNNNNIKSSFSFWRDGKALAAAIFDVGCCRNSSIGSGRTI